MLYGSDRKYNDVNNDAEELKSDLSGAMGLARDEVKAAAREAAYLAQEKITGASRAARQAGQQVDAYTKEHTWAAVAVAAAVGMVLGALLSGGRRRD